jgi:hypothetical protein
MNLCSGIRAMVTARDNSSQPNVMPIPIGKSGWYSLLAFVPYVGGLVLLLWTAVELPAQHSRSRWWTLLLLIPGVNLVANWFYAFTLPRNDVSFA